MKEPLGPPREVGEGYKYVSLGLTFAGGIIFFMGMGFLLDRWLGWMPVLTVAGTLVGAVLSFLNVYWKLQADETGVRRRAPAGSHRKRRGSVKQVAPGLVLTAVVTALLVWVFGRVALMPALVFGGIATAVQLAASRLLRQASGKSFEQLLKAWGLGMALRMAGMLLFLGAVLTDRTLFPPLPTALAYVGVLIPLMFSDLRTIR